MKAMKVLIVILVLILSLVVGLTTVVHAEVDGCRRDPSNPLCRTPVPPVVVTPEPNDPAVPIVSAPEVLVRSSKCDVTLYVSALNPNPVLEYKGEGTMCLILPLPGAYSVTVQNLK